MNEAPSNQTGLNDTFSSQPAPQTNPFTADLKGEFTSNFGTNTNAVSQIFKEGGFVGQNRTKYLIIGGVVILALALVFFFAMDDNQDEAFPTAGEDAATTDSAETDEPKTEGDELATADSETATVDDEAASAETSDEQTAAVAETGASAVPSSIASSGGKSFGSGAVTLTEPAEGSMLNYDESQGAAVFNWTGGGGHIVFSRHQSMNPPALRMRVNGNSYAFQHPWPGTWFWRVENASGQSEVRSFKVNAPTRRAVSLQQPTAGGAIAGNGGTVTWQGDAKVAYYRVEMSTGSLTTPQHRFASSGNSVQLNGVAPGQYQMRVGAFSEVSGRWEYTTPVSVTVQ